MLLCHGACTCILPLACDYAQACAVHRNRCPVVEGGRVAAGMWRWDVGLLLLAPCQISGAAMDKETYFQVYGEMLKSLDGQDSLPDTFVDFFFERCDTEGKLLA